MFSDSELTVVVLGLGYIDLPTAAVIARPGAQVLRITRSSAASRHRAPGKPCNSIADSSAACVTTTARAAEMTKLTENASRDVNIAFANELSLIADTMQVDAWEVIQLVNRYPRVNI